MEDKPKIAVPKVLVPGQRHHNRKGIHLSSFQGNHYQRNYQYLFELSA